MSDRNLSHAKVVPFPDSKKGKVKKTGSRKGLINRNREGSVRKIGGKVYVDFIYLDERVRECSKLPWNDQNARAVRDQMDKIIVAVKSGTFRFAEVFPDSKRKDYFAEKERMLFELKLQPNEVKVGEYILTWYERLKASGRVTGRTLFGYKQYIDCYLLPFFEKLKFADLNKVTFDRLISWARGRKLKGKQISNTTVNKIFVPLKTACKDAAIEYGWVSYSPFFGYQKLKEDDSYEKINPCSLDEQHKIIEQLPEHWQPYICFSFYSGLRHGEQIAIKLEDIDFEKGLLHIRRAITLDEDGTVIEGKTKNKYSRRTIKLTPRMLWVLSLQKEICDRLQGAYFFCKPDGSRVDMEDLRLRVWKPALKKAGLDYRDLKQTRHSFATAALSNRVNPLMIAKVMGHRNTEMIIKVYGKYVEAHDNDQASMDMLNDIFC